MLMPLEIMFFVALVVLSAFFSSAEVAFTGLTLSQMRRIKRLRPGALTLWERSPDRVLAGILLANNAVNTAVGTLAAAFGMHLARGAGWSVPLVSFVSGLAAGTILLFLGELLPKILARHYTLMWALRVAPLVNGWCRMTSFLTDRAVRVTHMFLVRPFRGRRGTLFLQPGEIRRILGHAQIPQGARRMLDNVMDFSKSAVRDVMTSRSAMFAVPDTIPMPRLIQSIVRMGFSRVPVYSGSLDRIIGILYAKDLLVAWRSGRLVVLQDLLRPAWFVRRDQPLPELLRAFRTGHQHMAIVLEESSARRVAGLVTIQDALEAIVGPVREEL